MGSSQSTAQQTPASLPNNKVLAAVDIGSNSIHLIVARMVMGSLQPLQRYRERVQLAAGLTNDQWLDEEAFARGLACLERMGKLLLDHRPDHVRVVATFTLRHAKNRNAFLLKGEQLLGYPIDIISGREEARLIFQGVAHSETLTENTLVIDIGGGSTELALGSGFDPLFRESCRMGCVSFSRLYFSSGINKKAFEKAHKNALQAMEKYLPRLAKLSWQRVYATSGTAKTLEKVCTDLFGENGAISHKQLQALKKRLLAEKGLGWLADLGVSDDRINLVPGGLAILLAIADTLDIDALRYKDVALREGVLYEMDEQMRHPDIRQRTRSSLQALYQVDQEHAARVADSVVAIVESLGPDWLQLPSPIMIDLLTEAAQLHEVGIQISANGSQRHSAYIIENSDLPGYNQEQQQLLAELIRWHRKRIRPEEFSELRIVDKTVFARMLLVLRFAVLLNITRKPVDLAKIDFRIKQQQLRCAVEQDLLLKNPLLEADLAREARYLKALDIELMVA